MLKQVRGDGGRGRYTYTTSQTSAAQMSRSSYISETELPELLERPGCAKVDSIVDVLLVLTEEKMRR